MKSGASRSSKFKCFMITLLSVGKVGGGSAEGHAAFDISDTVI